MKAPPTPTRSMNDEELLQFPDFVHQHAAHVRSVVSALEPDRHAQDDIVQDTFVLAFTRLGQLRDCQSVRPWLAAIARNRVIEMQRRRIVRVRHETAADPKGSKQPDDDWIWEEVEQLPSEHATVLRCRYILQMTYEEIATQHNLNVSTVRGRIYEARRALRRRLTQRGLFP